jgi:hypothetical protein
VEGLTDVVQIDTGNDHTCARLRTGTVACWGGNDTPEANVPAIVDGLTAIDISAGGNTTCARTADRRVWCWGDTYLEAGFTLRPVRVEGLTDAETISVGWTHACAVVQGGRALCWGANGLGQVGADASTQALFPPTTPRWADGAEIGGIADVRADWWSTCARLETGGVVCWGAALTGELHGYPPWVPWRRPAPVHDLDDAQQLAYGQNGAGCALVPGGRVRCWPAPLTEAPEEPTDEDLDSAPVGGIIGARGVFVSAYFSCAVLTDQSLHCWGGLPGTEGEPGPDYDRPTRVPVPQ